MKAFNINFPFLFRPAQVSGNGFVKYGIIGVVAIALIMLENKYDLSLLMFAKLTEEKSDEQPLGLPMRASDAEVFPLRTLVDDNLQNDLSAIVAKNKKWAMLAKNMKLSIGFVDLRDPSNVKFASINGNNMMYPATLPKIAVLLAATDAIEKGS
ncbi:MAG: beta-lactamase class A [Roseivirga sp.]|jgi:beta-lactamase class A